MFAEPPSLADLRLEEDVRREIIGRIEYYIRAVNDEVERSWEILDPVIDYWHAKDTGPDPYPAGSWGPESASAMRPVTVFANGTHDWADGVTWPARTRT